MALLKFGKKFGKNKKEASKFKITTIFQHIECELVRGYLPTNINIKWSRGHREVCSDSPKWESISEDDSVTEGKAVFKPPSECELLITLYRNQKDLQYDDKIYRYTVEDVDVDKKKRLMGIFDINIAEYAATGNTRTDILLDCKTSSKKVLLLKVYVSVDVEFIKSGKPQDDDLISTWSTLQIGNIRNSDESDDSDAGNSPSTQSRNSNSLYIVLGQQPATYFSNSKSEFVIPGKDEVDIGYFSECKAIGLLFSANWSDTCVKFFRVVNTFYNSVIQKYRKLFELIYVSSDYELSNLEQTIGQNNIIFPCIKPDSNLRDILKDHFEIQSLPQLVIINPRTGKVIDKDGRNALEKYRNSNENLEGLIACWMKGRSGDKISDIISKSTNPSFLETVSELSPLNTNKRKGSMRIGKETAEQTIYNLEWTNKQLVLDIAEKSEYILGLQTQIHELNTENEMLKTQNFELKEQNLELIQTNLKYHSENEDLVEQKKQLAVSMDIKGWLFKRGVSGPTGKKWRKRYFSIDGNQLYYFKSINSEKAKGSIDIVKIQHINVLPSEAQDKNGASFNIVTPSRTYELQAKSRIDMESWMKAVHYTVDYLTANKRFSQISTKNIIMNVSPIQLDIEPPQIQPMPATDTIIIESPIKSDN